MARVSICVRLYVCVCDL